MDSAALHLSEPQVVETTIERPIVNLGPEDILAFVRGGEENQKFWARFGGMPDLTGKTVADIGSGWGRLCFDLAISGAERVIGLEIKQNLVDFSNALLRQAYPMLTDRVRFEHCDLRQYAPDAAFDYIFSKDSFEHILDLESMLLAMRERLKPGGRIYAGFGPLYTSPYGDHDRRETAFAHFGSFGKAIARVPWLHLPLEPLVVRLHSERGKKNVRTIQDLGLNGLGMSDYRRAFAQSGLRMVEMRINQSPSVVSRVLATMAKVPLLEDYCVHNLYCVLEKR